MASPAAVELLANNLHCLPRPDGGTITLAGYHTPGMHPEQAAERNRHATMLAEAIVHLLERDGRDLTTEAERAAATNAAPAPAAQQVAVIRCAFCDAELFAMTITDPDQVRTNGPAFIAAVAARSTDCATGHQTTTA